MTVQLDEVVVGHAGDVVHHDIVGIALLVGQIPLVVNGVHKVDVMLVNGRILVLALQVVQKLTVDLSHHGANRGVQLGKARGVVVDAGVVVQAGLAEGLEVLPITVEGLPGGTITVRHTLELYKTFIGLLLPGTLPLVGRVTDIEGIVISDSSWLHVLIHFKLID